jgi:hypothetical protein
MMAATVKEKILTFRPDADVFEAMEMLKKRDGILFGEQVRRALRLWLETKDVMPKAKGKGKKPMRRTQ